jgi:hypothetical protein
MPRRSPERQAPKATHRNVLHLRLDDDLRAKLQREADRHQTPLLREIRNRLLDSLERDDRSRMADLIQSMQMHWARIPARDERIRLDEMIVQALAHADDLAKIKTLAREWLKMYATERQQTEEKKS